MNTFNTQIVVRGGKNNQTKRVFLDFVIDNKSLWELVKSDFITGFGWPSLEWQKKYAEVLLLKAPTELASGRIPIYICPECGDLGCGAITVEVEKKNSSIIWKKFGFENNYENDIRSVEELKNIGPYEFNKTEYWNIINNSINQIE